MDTLVGGHTRRARLEEQGFRADLQGMRALAVLGVVLYHAGVPWLPGGYVGVDVFFVISGYLITGLLYREIRSTGRVALWSFYARRIRRLLPASALVLLATLAAAKILLPPLLLVEASRDAMATAVFLPNMFFAYTGTDYLAGSAPSLFQHYWSLALEEQFYMIWPLVMMIAAGSVRGQRFRIRAVLLVLSAASLVGCVLLTSINQPWAFFGLPTRAWELGVGGLLALSYPAIRRMNPWLHRVMAWSGFALILAVMVLFTEELVFPGWAATIPCLGALAMIAGGCGEETPLGFLNNRIIQYFGSISYSLYLWHWPVLIIPGLMLDGPKGWWVSAVGVFLSIGLAHLTYKLVERKFQLANAFRRSTPRSYALGAGLTIIALLCSFGLGKLPDLHTSQPAEAPRVSALISENAAKYVPSNVSPTLLSSRDSLSAVYTNGCHADFQVTLSPACTYGAEGAEKTIVLFGDSHAAQWFSPLRKIAEDSDLRLVSLTKSSCPSVTVPVGRKASPEYPECAEWRANAIRRISDLKPDVVIMSNYSANYRTLGHAGPSGFADAWRTGLSTTLQGLPAKSSVVVLGDTPAWPSSPNICLSAHITTADACAAPVRALLDAEALSIEQEVAQAAGATSIQPSAWLCGETCPPIAGNVLVYRDENHITDAMALVLSDNLKPIIQDALRTNQAR
ncbi:acyltransferase [Arthrobacter sp. TS-15]|uniref:acyltransferase family protein n=1 Tax=Arthrobacter sp. TS-15 TaxID=2510797 RepID=UPI00115E8442|nr:acyltransferase family protein [Arthrobacter sp. TS-15]TQS92780.1 acyltransferase [Arthrobacter sp. TS-15]